MRITQAARAAGLLAALCYGTGLLTISVYLGQYGVSDFGLLRSRIFLAGALFVFLSAAPAYAALRLFGRLGPTRPRPPFGRPITRVRLYKLDLGFCLLPLSFYEAWATGLLLSESPSARLPEHPWVLLTFPFVFLVMALLANLYFDRVWPAFLTASLLADVGLLWMVERFSSRGFLWVLVWYFAVSVLAVILFESARDLRARHAFQWEWLPFWLLSVLFFYSIKVYPAIAPQFGGGSPRRVEVYVDAKSPLGDPGAVNALLLDETDAGFYLLRSENDRSACYLKRGLVSAISFNPPARTPRGL